MRESGNKAYSKKQKGALEVKRADSQTDQEEVPPAVNGPHDTHFYCFFQDFKLSGRTYWKWYILSWCNAVVPFYNVRLAARE